jgi:DNA-binding transcriptional MerR regulator
MRKEVTDEMQQPGTCAVPNSQLFSESPASRSTARWLRVLEFCALYGVTPCTARRWVQQGRVRFIRVPPHHHGRLFIADPGWTRIDPPTSGDASEWLCVLRQCDVALLLGISSRALRYLESSGRAKFRLVGHQKRYSLSEVRRLLAQRQNGRKNVTRNERQMALVRWAAAKLASTPAAR